VSSKESTNIPELQESIISKIVEESNGALMMAFFNSFLVRQPSAAKPSGHSR